MIRLVNGIATLATIGFSVGLIVDPGLAVPAGTEITAGLESYAWATAARSIGLGVVLLYVLAHPGPALVPLLVVTGLTQVGDAVIHAIEGNPPLIAGAVLLAAVPFGSVWVSRHQDG